MLKSVLDKVYRKDNKDYAFLKSILKVLIVYISGFNKRSNLFSIDLKLV